MTLFRFHPGVLVTFLRRLGCVPPDCRQTINNRIKSDCAQPKHYGTKGNEIYPKKSLHAIFINSFVIVFSEPLGFKTGKEMHTKQFSHSLGVSIQKL